MKTTSARAAFLPHVQTIYCNWWDAEEPRNSSGPSTSLEVNEWREEKSGTGNLPSVPPRPPSGTLCCFREYLAIGFKHGH
jgi:hypothetical protein